MAYPLSPALTAARARLQSGERLSARDVWESDARICRSAAHVTLTRRLAAHPPRLEPLMAALLGARA